MVIVQLVNGIMEGMMLFLIASGLTLIFGVSRIINFAHGSFYMVGAFLTYALVPYFGTGSLVGFLFAVLIATSLTAALGVIFEMQILRRLYAAPELLQLLSTIALVLILRDVVKTVWGLNDVIVPMPDALTGALKVGGYFFPIFQLAVVAAGLAVLLVMVSIIRFTRAGILLRAATDDRGMVALLGVNQKRVFTVVFGSGCFLAGLAGGLASPFGNINYLLDTTVIIDAFIVVVIGGLGNLWGALVAALTVGILKALGILYFPRLAMVMIFVIMAVVLVARSLGRRGIDK